MKFPDTPEGIKRAIDTTPVGEWWEARVAWGGPPEYAQTDEEVEAYVAEAREWGADIGALTRQHVEIVDVELPDDPADPA